MAAPMPIVAIAKSGTFRFKHFRQIACLQHKRRLSFTSAILAGHGEKKRINVHEIFCTDTVPLQHESGPCRFTGGWPTYSRMLQVRKTQADHCILVETESAEVASSFCDQLGKIGKVKSAFYANDHVLVEFENEDCIKRLPDIGFVPATKPVWNNRVLRYEPRVSSSAGNFPVVVADQKNKPLLSDLLSIKTISEQIEHLSLSHHLSDFGSRLRHFVCSALEQRFSSTFTHCSIEPYGSCVNGFGMDGCDLDMMLTIFSSKIIERRVHSAMEREKKERMLSRHMLTRVTNTLRHIPSCSKVQRILFARVPIAKFKTLNIDCDMSIQNKSGSLMSELMYMFSKFDPRVKPLVAVVKYWARANHLVSSGPTNQPTSFHWLMLVIFFLQNKSILPTVQALENCSRKQPDVVVDDRELKSLVTAGNEENLETLLMEFFLFYSTFDFENQALSLIEGSSFPKPTSSAVYIETPLPIGRENLAKNISVRSSRQLAECMTESLAVLEKSDLQSQTFDWRLVQLLDSSTKGPQFKVTDLYLPSEELEGQDSEELSTSEIKSVENELPELDRNLKQTEEEMKEKEKKSEYSDSVSIKEKSAFRSR